MKLVNVGNKGETTIIEQTRMIELPFYNSGTDHRSINNDKHTHIFIYIIYIYMIHEQWFMSVYS